jgi:hypothetical protein
MSKNDAKLEFVALLNDLSPGWQSYEGFKDDGLGEQVYANVNSSFDGTQPDRLLGRSLQDTGDGDGLDAVETNASDTDLDIRLKLDAIQDSVSEDKHRLHQLELKLLNLTEKALTKAEPHHAKGPAHTEIFNVGNSSVQSVKEELMRANEALRKELETKGKEWERTQLAWSKKFEELQSEQLNLARQKGSQLAGNSGSQHSLEHYINLTMKFLKKPNNALKVLAVIAILLLVRRRLLK